MKTCFASSPTATGFSPLLFTGDLSTAFNRAVDLGYDGIELNLRDCDEIDQAHVIRMASDLGLKVPSIGSGQLFFKDNLSLANPDKEVMEQVRERLRGHIRLAAKLGAAVVLGSVRGALDTTSQAQKASSREAALESTCVLADWAADYGVELTLEPINRYETNFINTISEAVEFIDEVGRSNIGLLADTFHMNIEETRFGDSLRQAAGRLRHIHLVESNRCAPGMGHIDFDEVFSALRDLEYDGFLSAEILPLPDDETAARCWLNAVHGRIGGADRGISVVPSSRAGSR
jgi:sugar phosphate isomerase/epimerase